MGVPLQARPKTNVKDSNFLKMLLFAALFYQIFTFGLPLAASREMFALEFTPPLFASCCEFYWLVSLANDSKHLNVKHYYIHVPSFQR